MDSNYDVCLVDSATTHTILRDRKYFHNLIEKKGSVTTIANNKVLIVGFGRTSVILPMGTELIIENALLYPKSKRTLLSFKNIRSRRIEFRFEKQ